MAFGLAAPGLAPGGVAGLGPFRSIHEYRESIREIDAEGLVDIMLMSGSTCELLAIDEGLFARSAVTPAARMNDTTDYDRTLVVGVLGAGRARPTTPSPCSPLPSGTGPAWPSSAARSTPRSTSPRSCVTCDWSPTARSRRRSP